MTTARLAPAHAARSHARPRDAGRLLALSADVCACVVLSAVIPLALIYGTTGQLRPPGLGLPAMAAVLPAGAVIGRTGRDWEMLMAGLAAIGLAGQLGDIARSFALTELDTLVGGAGAGLALAGAVALARARQHARTRAAGPGAVPLRWWWAAVTVSAVAGAPVLGAGQAGVEPRDLLTVGVLAGQTVVLIAMAAVAGRGRPRRVRPVFLVLAAAAGCTLTVAGSLMLDRQTLPLAASSAFAAAAFAARRPAAGVGAILLAGGVLAYLLAASPAALEAGLPAALLAAALAAALSAALGRGAFGAASPPYLKTYAAGGARVRYPGATRPHAAWPGGHQLAAGAVVLVCGIGVGYLTIGALQGNGYSGAASNINVVRRYDSQGSRIPGLSTYIHGRSIIVSQRTLILIKPDAVRRELIGAVIARIERKGLRVIAMDLRTIDRQSAQSHYAEHEGKPFYAPLVEFITGGPLVALVAEGPRAIEAFRALAGATDPVKALPGTIRGDYALEVGENMVHGSDSPASAAREIKIFFPDLV